MNYFKRPNIWKNHNSTNTFNPETLEAYSYGWWKYLGLINGVLVFNDFSYSPTTIRHQSNLKRLLDELNIIPDVYIECPYGLQNLQSAIEYYKSEIDVLKAEINKPKTHKSKNKERQEQINYLKSKIKEVKKLIV